MLLRINYLLISLLLLSAAKGQKLLDYKPYDTSAYVYKLNPAQMDFIVERNNIVDTSFLFTQLYKKFSRNSNYNAALPNGNYLVATVDQATIYYHCITISSFEIKHKVIDNEVILFIKDKKSRANISTAEVKIVDALVPFNEGYGGYAFDKNSVDAQLLAKYKTLLRVNLGNEYFVTHYSLYNAYQSDHVRQRFFSGSKSYVSSGYVITDKPVYRPGDTLRLKAFLCNPLNGKPQKRRANFYMNEPMQNFALSKKLKAVSPGAFLFEWKIPDTLKIDRNFQMNFSYKIRRHHFNYASSFYLENYVLNTTQYDAQILKQEFYPNEDIAFRVKASDANGFPLQGTMVHYKLSLNSVQDFFGDTLTISAAKRQNMYEHDTLFPYENYIDLKIPSAVLPNMDANYGIEVTVTDPTTFEQKQFLLNCVRLRKTEKFEVYQMADSLYMRFLYNGRDSLNTYNVATYSNGDTLQVVSVTTPYHFQLSPYATQVIITDEKKQSTTINVNFNALDISKIEGERSADSIRIAFSFPFEEAIYYRILKKDKVIQQGKTKKLDYKIADNSKDPYTILFTSNLNNAIENNFYRISYVPPLHNIKLRSTLPAQAFPGQKLHVQVQATDCYDHPLKHINIAAYAVNKQFNERFTRPSITVPEEYKDLVQITAEPVAVQVNLSQNSFQLQSVLSPKNFSRFDLTNNEYYRLRYPKKDYERITKKIQSPLPEFAISVTANHIAYTPKYIVVDGQPVYISDLRVFPYSFQTNTGKHQISFRFSNKTITLNDVTFEAHTKNWLGFNIDSISTTTKNLVVVDSLPIAQPTEAEKTLLYSTLLLTNQFGYDSLIIQSGSETVFKSNANIRRQAIPLNVDGDYFYAFGPLAAASTANVKLNKKEFVLKTSTDYAHYYDPTNQTFTSKLRGPVKGAIFGFAEEQLSNTHFASMQVYDTVAPAPEQIQMHFNPDANKAIQTKQEPEYTQNYNSSGQASFVLFFKNNDTTHHVKAIWLINKKQSEQSEFRQVNYSEVLSNFYKNGEEGLYDVYFLFNNQKMLVLQDHQFSNGDEFYVNPFLLPSETLNNDRLASPLKVYTDLTKRPLLPFYFPPEETTENIKEIKDATRQKTYLHGYITDESLQPLANVLVMAEVNGKFMYGAMTNNVGEFEVLDMLPGSYQLKIYNAGFQIKSFSTRFFKAGNRYELSTSLKSSNLQKPVLETIQKEFRFMVFNGDARKDQMRLNVYDKETREALKNFTLTIREIKSELAEKTFVAKEAVEFSFLPQAQVYNLEISCKGYVPVVFYNVRFCKGSFYDLYLFMISEKENAWIKKKEYDLQMQNYSPVQAIGALAGDNPYQINAYSSAGAPMGAYTSREDYQNLATKDRISAYEVKRRAKASRARNAPEKAVVDAENFDEDGQALQEVTLASDSGFSEFAPNDLIDQLLNTADLSQTRKNFTDVGFWQPNLITDKKGKVNFEIRLPDNITTWKSNVIAMGNKHLHGIDTTEIRAYKPLQVSAIVPVFMWKGDVVWAKAKFTNLTKDPKTITASMSLNNTLLRKSEFNVKNDVVDSVQLSATVLGPLQYKASLQFEEKYKDEEQRDVLVYNPAFRFFKNQNFNMEKDSTYLLSFEKGTQGEIILNNNLYEKIVEEINQLSKYEYSCVEQTSSQLKALLCKEKINRVLQSKENLNPGIYKLVHQLENYQNKNGTWGWWKGQTQNWRMTIYAVEALGKAKSSGYNNNSFSKGVNAIKENFAGLSLSDRLYAYAVLQALGLGDAHLKMNLQNIKSEELSTTDKLYYYKLKEAEGAKIDFNELYAVYLELTTAMARPYYGYFFYEPRANLLEAYRLFSGSVVGKEWIELFKSKLLNGQLDYNLNTYAKAALIEALTASTAFSENKPVTAQVVINDSIKVKTFPYRLKISKTNYFLQHSDAGVFVNTAEEKWSEQPQRRDSLFKVTTGFVQNTKPTKELKAGQACQLNLDIDAYRGYDYVMIEIPLPSGMRVLNKAQASDCTIQYFNNKIVVFYQKLNMQQHHLSFDLLAMFKGSFVWPAAKCSLMYYPYIYGNNENQGVEVY